MHHYDYARGKIACGAVDVPDEQVAADDTEEVTCERCAGILFERACEAHEWRAQ